MQVDVRIIAFIAIIAVSNLENCRWLFGSVLNAMTVGGTSRESRTHTLCQRLFTVIRQQRHFTFENVNEFVFMGMPMPER